MKNDNASGPPNQIQEGGQLVMANEHGSINHYDPAVSTFANDAVVFNAIYDDLIVQNADGKPFNWMVKEYEITEVQDVGAEAYEPYMEEYEIIWVNNHVPHFDLDWPNDDLIHHPEDLAKVAEGELTAGDAMRILTREEAEKAVSDGVYGTKIKGRLHEGIQFHNSAECTAEDVVGSYNRFAQAANASHLFDTFLYATTSNGSDDYEFELYSQKPDAIAEVALQPRQVFPEEHHEIRPGGLDPREGGQMPVGTGPYQVTEFEEGNYVLLEKFEDYWLEDVGLEAKEWWDGPESFPEGPVIDEIRIEFIPDAKERATSLETGDIDIAYQLPANDLTTFEESEDFSVVAEPATGFLFQTFPLESTDHPQVEEGGVFAHREIRQAVSQLIPREEIAETVMGGWSEPGQVPFPRAASRMATTQDYETLAEKEWAYSTEPNHDEAEELVEKSGVDTPIDVTLETNQDDEIRQDKMELIVNELNESGLFDAELEATKDIGDWVVEDLAVNGSRFEYAERNAWPYIGLDSRFDPHGYASALLRPENHNFCCNYFYPEGTFDAEFIERLHSCRFGSEVARDPETRKERYDELWPEIADIAATTVVDAELSTAVTGPEVNGYSGYPRKDGFLEHSLYAPYDEEIAWLGFAVDMVAGREHDAGTVVVRANDETLDVTYHTTDDYSLTETHLAIGNDLDEFEDEGWVNPQGHPRPGRFPYSDDEGPTDSVTFSVPLKEIDAKAGDELVIAAHADVEEGDGNGRGQREAAWADGEEFTEVGGWSTYFEYTVR